MDSLKAGIQVASFEAAERIANTLPDIQDLFAKFKITNCLSRLVEIVNATSFDSAVHSIIQLLETYDVLWKIPASIADTFNRVLYYIVKNIPSMFKEIGDFLKNLGAKPECVDNVEELVNQSLGSADVFDLFSGMLGAENAVLGPIKTFLAQNGGLGVTILGWIGGLTLLFGGGALMFTSTLATRMSKTISNLGNTIKAMEFVSKGFNWVSNVVTEQVAGLLGIEIDRPKTPRDQLVEQIIKLGEEFKTTVADFREKPTLWLTSIKKIKKLNDSLDQVHKLYEDLAKSTDNLASCQSAIIELRQNIKSIRDFYDNIVNSMIGKVVPTTLYLYGTSGVGKSKVAEYIAELLRDGPDDISTVYTRNASDAYWSGYEGQKVVLYDDFNQDKENTDHKELIGIYTGASFLPKFAEITDKGKPFTSPYLILCSNNGLVESSKVVNTVEALDRRRDLVFKVRNPEYERMLRNNVPKEERLKCFKADFSHLEFEEMVDVRHKSGGMVKVATGARNSLHLIVATMKKIHAERQAEYQARVEEKMQAIKAGAFQYLDPQVQALLNDAKARIKTMPPPAAPVYQPDNSAGSGQSEDSDLTDEQIAYAEEHGFNLRPQMLRNQTRKGFERKPCLLLMGPPGIGKTEFLKCYTGDAYDEFPADDDTFLEAIKYVWAVYDGEEDPAVLTCNPTTMDAMFMKHFPNDAQKKQAFLRRCEIFDFSFSMKSRIWRTYYTMNDLFDGKSYDDIVTIKQTSINGQQRTISKRVMERILEEGIVVKQEVQRSTALRELDVVCDIEIGFGLTSEEVAKPDFSIKPTEVWKMIKTFKGNPYIHIHRLQDIAALFGKKVGDLEDAMMTLNDLERDPKGLPSVGITFGDGKRFVLVTNEEGHLEVCKAPHIYKEVNCSADELRKLTLERLKRDNPSSFVFFQFFDLIGFVIKFGVVFCSVYRYGTRQAEHKKEHERRSKEKARMIKALVNEGYDYDDVDDFFDDYYTYMGKPHPKSYLNKVRKDVYCQIHHCMDRCYLMEAEASRKPLLSAYNEDMRRGKHVDHSFILESGDEYKNVTRKHVTPVVVEESGDEYKNVTRKHVTPVVVEECGCYNGRKRAHFDCAFESGDEYKNVTRKHAQPIVVDESIRGRKIKNGIIAELKQGKMDYLVPETALDPGAIMQSHVVFKNNLVAQKNGMTFNRVLMLKQHIGVINNHAVPNTQTLDVFDGVNTWPAQVFYRNEKKDLAFFKISTKAPQFADITHYLITRSGLRSLENRHGILITPYREKGAQIFGSWKAIMIKDAVERAIEGKQRYGVNYSGHSLGITYNSTPIGTQPGDCGSAIILNDPHINQKLVGIHSAGSQHNGFGAIITQEDVSDACKILTSETKDIPIKVLKHQMLEEDVEGTLLGMEVFATMRKDGKILKQFVPETTKFHNSPFAFDEKFGHMFEPAVMSEKDSRCTPGAMPYKDAISKWNNPQPEVDEQLLDLAVSEIGCHLGQIIMHSGYKIGVLSKTESINGVGGTPGSNAIYRQSSAGYPWKHMEGLQKKSTMFELDPDTKLQVIAKNKFGKALHHAVDSLICCAKEGFRPAVVFCSALKDEPLKLKKIYDATKTRTFAASPVDYTIASRMYFHSVAGALTSLFHLTPIKIGINPAGTDFHDLYLYHAAVSTAGFDGDFANWDGTIPKIFMEKAGEIYNIIYQMCDKNWKPEDDIIRRNLHACVEGPLLNYKETVVKAPGGNPSGQPQTTLDNCLCNYILGYYVFAKVMKANNKDWSFMSFLKNVRPSYFGDDNMYTVAPEVIEFFNFVTFKQEAEKIGFTLTNAAKDGKEQRFILLKDMEFLKRNFVKIDGRYYGALLDASICKMLGYAKGKAHWYDKDKDKVGYDRETIEDTIQPCLIECALKGREFYDEIAQHLRKRITEYHFDSTIPTYDSALVQALYEGASSLVEKFKVEHELENQTKGPYKLTVYDPETDEKETIIVNRGTCCLPLLDVAYDEDGYVDRRNSTKSEDNWIKRNHDRKKILERASKKSPLSEHEIVTALEHLQEKIDEDLEREEFCKQQYGMTRAQFMDEVIAGRMKVPGMTDFEATSFEDEEQPCLSDFDEEDFVAFDDLEDDADQDDDEEWDDVDSDDSETQEASKAAYNDYLARKAAKPTLNVNAEEFKPRITFEDQQDFTPDEETISKDVEEIENALLSEESEPENVNENIDSNIIIFGAEHQQSQVLTGEDYWTELCNYEIHKKILFDHPDTVHFDPEQHPRNVEKRRLEQRERDIQRFLREDLRFKILEVIYKKKEEERINKVYLEFYAKLAEVVKKVEKEASFEKKFKTFCYNELAILITETRVKQQRENGCTTNNSGGINANDGRGQHTRESGRNLWIRSPPAVISARSGRTWHPNKRCGPVSPNTVCDRLDNIVDRSNEPRDSVVLKANTPIVSQRFSEVPNQTVQLLEGVNGVQDVPSRNRIQCRENRNIQVAPKQEARRYWRHKRVVISSIRSNGCEADASIHESGVGSGEHPLSLQSTGLKRLLNFWWLLCNCRVDEACREATGRFHKSDDSKSLGRRFRSWPTFASKLVHWCWDRSKSVQFDVSSTSRPGTTSVVSSPSRLYKSVTSCPVGDKERVIWSNEARSNTSITSSRSRKTRPIQNESLGNETSLVLNRMDKECRSRRVLAQLGECGRSSGESCFSALHCWWTKVCSEAHRRLGLKQRRSEHGQIRHNSSSYDSAGIPYETKRGSSNKFPNLQRRKSSGLQFSNDTNKSGHLADESQHRSTEDTAAELEFKRMCAFPIVRSNDRAANNAVEAISRRFLYHSRKCVYTLIKVFGLQNRVYRKHKQDSTNTSETCGSIQSELERNDSFKRNSAILEETMGEIRDGKGPRTHAQRNFKNLKIREKPTNFIHRIIHAKNEFVWTYGVAKDFQPQYDSSNPDHFQFPHWYPMEEAAPTEFKRFTNIFNHCKFTNQYSHLQIFNLLFPKNMQGVYDKTKQAMASVAIGTKTLVKRMRPSTFTQKQGYEILRDNIDEVLFDSNVNGLNDLKNLKRNDAATRSTPNTPGAWKGTRTSFGSASLGSNLAERRTSAPLARPGGATSVLLPGTHTSSTSTDTDFSDKSSSRGNTGGGVNSITSGVPFDAGSSRTYRDNRFKSNSFSQTNTATKTAAAQTAANTASKGHQAGAQVTSRTTQANPSTRSTGSQAEIGNKRSGKSALVAGAVAGHVVASGITTAGGIVQEKMRINAQKSMQKSRQDFATGMLDRRVQAYESQGLPSYLAYGKSDANTGYGTHTGQVYAGKSVYQGQIPGNSHGTAYTGSQGQVANGWGAVI